MKSPLRCPLLIFLFSISAFAGQAQNFQLKWANTLSSTGGTVSIFRIITDSSGNIYATGYFTGTVDFDPGAGNADLTSDTAFGKGTNFLAKYDAQGGLVFARQLGPSITDFIIAPDGSICFTGGFRNTVDMDAGTGTAPLTSTGSYDFYVSRYTAAGAYISAFRIGGAGSDYAEAITVDAAGNAYVTGSFSGTANFDPGAGVMNLVSNGSTDIYLAKYSAAGALLFAFRLNGVGSNGTEEGVSLAADASGVYLGGRFIGTIDLGPRPGNRQFYLKRR